jgi:uncharacterized membrane protein
MIPVWLGIIAVNQDLAEPAIYLLYVSAMGVAFQKAKKYVERWGRRL